MRAYGSKRTHSEWRWIQRHLRKASCYGKLIIKSRRRQRYEPIVIEQD